MILALDFDYLDYFEYCTTQVKPHGHEQIRPYLCAASRFEVLQLVHIDLPLTVAHQNTVCLSGEQQNCRIHS